MEWVEFDRLQDEMICTGRTWETARFLRTLQEQGRGTEGTK